jgi:hypothetical protein
MRWLVVLASVIAGAAGVMLWMLSSGGEPVRSPPSPPPSPSHAAPEHEEKRVVPERIVAVPSTPRPAATLPRVDVAPTRPSDPPAPPTDAQAAPVAEETDEVPDTEQQMLQRWYTANARLEGGNYPGAIEAALGLAKRHPTWSQDAWHVAIQAYCALDDSASARAMFANLTDPRYVPRVIEVCASWNIKLVKP